MTWSLGIVQLTTVFKYMHAAMDKTILYMAEVVKEFCLLSLLQGDVQ